MTAPFPLILYVITDLELGGVPLHLSRLAKAMRDRGFRIVVVSLTPIGPIGPILSKEGIEVRTCNGCCGLDFRVISRLGEIIDDLQPDLIHSFLFHANQAARIAAILSGFPTDRILCEIQTVEVERPWHLWVDRVMHRFCRLTIGNSPSVIEHLHCAAEIPRHRLHLVRGGIDINRITNAAPALRSSLNLPARPIGTATAREPRSISTATAKERCWPPETAHQQVDHDRLIMWIGRLDPVKGLDHLLQAMRIVVNQFNAHLLLIGDGPERQRLEALAETLQLQSCVHFLGPRSDVPSLLKIADCFVFPSRTEGLPNALLEAMAAGKPIVTTDVPGCRDLIAHEQTGLLVPYGDTRALTTAIIRLLSEPDIAHRLGHQAHRSATENWNVESTWRAYESIYRQTVAEYAQKLPRFRPADP